MSKLSSATLKKIRLAAYLIMDSQDGAALTGAGISTPSGIPDFRSTGSGLWARYDPMEVASLSAFRYNPETFYKWLHSLVAQLFEAMPNPAHHAFSQLERAGYIKTIITQNIDGLHHRANSRNVLEVHGTLQTLTCIQCFKQVPSEGFIEPYIKTGEIPYCPGCDGILKPDIVLFEEQLPVRTWLRAQEACKKCDLLLVTGSSLEVMPVAGLPMRVVERGAQLIIVNQTSTYIDDRADVVLRGDVAEVLPRIAVEIFG